MLFSVTGIFRCVPGFVAVTCRHVTGLPFPVTSLDNCGYSQPLPETSAIRRTNATLVGDSFNFLLREFLAKVILSFK